jgi:hypothetical protein
VPLKTLRTVNKFLPAGTGPTLHWICEPIVSVWKGRDTLQRANLLVVITRIANQNPPLDRSPRHCRWKDRRIGD